MSKNIFAFIALVTATVLFSFSPAFAERERKEIEAKAFPWTNSNTKSESSESHETKKGPVKHRAVQSAISPSLRSLKPVHNYFNFSGEEEEENREVYLFPLYRSGTSLSENIRPLDPVAQTNLPAPNMPVPQATFEGLGAELNQFFYNFLVQPPDPSGDVGPDQYVQTVNNAIGVFDKNTGAYTAGPVPYSALFGPLGQECSSASGDGIVQYDHLTDRWIISQFSFFGPPGHQCVAISKTGDAAGEYYLYDFVLPNDKFNDYPKFGV